MRKYTGVATTGLLAIASAAFSTHAGAEATPLVEPGVEQRQLQLVDPERYRVSPPVKIDVPALPPMKAVPDTQLNVDRYTFSGNTLFDDAALAALLAGHTGSITFEKLVDAARIISEHYRAAGYIVARAYIPEQEISSGTIDIAVLEGAVGNIRLTGDTPVTRERLVRRMDRLAQSGVINEADLEYGALLINDLAGTDASVALVPGTSPGYSDVEVDVKDTGTLDVTLDYNNFGTPVTGEHRLGALFGINNIFDAGDRLVMRPILSSSGDTVYGSIGYDFPLPWPAASVGVLFSYLDSRLGEEFADLEIENNATTVDLHGTWTFVRSRNKNITGRFAYETRAFQRECGICAGQLIPIVEDADYQLDIISLSAAGDFRDERWGGGITSWHAELRNGLSAIDPPTSGIIISGRERAEGEFTSLRLGAQRLQRINDLYTFSARLEAQFSGNDLDASERIGLGGPGAVRAYMPSEALGDSGYVLQTELRRQIPALVDRWEWLTGMEGYLLLDAGASSLNDNGDNISRELDNTRTGIGLGVRLTGFKTFHLDIAGAFRLTDEESLVDQPDDSESNFWVQMIYWF